MAKYRGKCYIIGRKSFVDSIGGLTLLFGSDRKKGKVMKAVIFCMCLFALCSNAGWADDTSPLYSDKGGWMINAQVSPDFYARRYQELKSIRDDPSRPATNRQTAAGKAEQYKVYQVFDREGIDHFWVFTLETGGQALYWDRNSRVHLQVVSKSDTLDFISEDIIFSKNEQREIYRTSQDVVIVSDDGNWDTARTGIIIVAKFDFRDNEPSPKEIRSCRVIGVSVIPRETSSR